MAYMDDIIIISSNLELAHCHIHLMLKLLDNLGWQVNFEKSDLEPGQVKEFLGLLVDMLGPPTFCMLLRKLHALCHDSDHLHLAAHMGEVLVWKLMVVVGQGVALMCAVLLVKLLLWNAYCDIVHWMSWSASVRLSSATLCNLWEWWHSLALWNGQVAMMQPHDALLNTNASLGGWGASLAPTSSSQTHSAAGWWPKGELCHINVLEITTVQNALFTFHPLIQGKAVRILEADQLSHLYPHHEWQITPHLFHLINKH